jgi:hypothetical protein
MGRNIKLCIPRPKILPPPGTNTGYPKPELAFLLVTEKHGISLGVITQTLGLTKAISKHLDTVALGCPECLRQWLPSLSCRGTLQIKLGTALWDLYLPSGCPTNVAKRSSLAHSRILK